MQFSILGLTATLSSIAFAAPTGKYFGLIVIRPSTEYQNQGLTYNSETNELKVGSSNGTDFSAFWRPDHLVAIPEGKFINIDFTRDTTLYAHGGGVPFDFDDNDVMSFNGDSSFVLRGDSDGKNVLAYDKNDQKDGDVVVQLRAVTDSGN